jgi:hypothetical protein
MSEFYTVFRIDHLLFEIISVKNIGTSLNVKILLRFR